MARPLSDLPSTLLWRVAGTLVVLGLGLAVTALPSLGVSP